MRLRQAIPAGLADAAFASLGTFAAGLVAARTLDVVVLGAYAIFLRSYLLATVFPTHLVLVPAGVEILPQEQAERALGLGLMLRVAAPVAIVTALGATGLGIALTSATLPIGDLVALAATTGTAALLSPLQDHARRLLHLAGRSWSAAMLSLTFFLTVVAAIIGMTAFGVRPTVIPLGSLAVANGVSLMLGLALTHNARHVPVAGDYGLRHLATSGRWLVTAALVPNASNLAAAAVVAGLAGSDALGYAEAARVAAQPILVLSLGIAAVVNPRAMDAARAGDRGEARRLSSFFDLFLLAAGLVFLALFGFEWRLNFLADLVPQAYVVGGLVAVTIAANTVIATAQPFRAELIAGHRARSMAGVELWANPVVLLVAATAAVTKAFAIPLGLLAGGVIRFTELRRRVNAIYAGPEPPTGSEPAADGRP